jgi:hypothetical protein
LSETVWEKLFKEVVPEDGPDANHHDCHGHGSKSSERTISREQFKKIMKNIVNVLNQKK